MKKNVLVFPCGSEIGLEINRSLKYSKDFVLYGGSSADDHGKFAYGNYIPNIPNVNDENFISKIIEVVEKFKIDYIFPAHDSVVFKLAKNQLQVKAKIITSPFKTVEICRSKLKTYNYFSDILNTPEVYKLEQDIEFPVFLKPEVGQGSKGTQLASTQKEVEIALNKDKSLLILEYLPNEEYTIDCFTNYKGKLIFTKARERTRIANGISVNSKFVEDNEFKATAEIINSKLNFRGVWFFQLKKDKNNKFTLLEIAPRVAGTMSLSRMQGVNLPLLSLYDLMGIDVSIFENNFKSEVDRALANKFALNIEYKNVYVDFDDVIVCNDKVNELLIAFLYKCINQDKKIFLITKHEKDIKITLKNHRITEEIFDRIIHITREDEKNLVIDQDSIFIDDSFSERKKVFEKLGIPVFDVSEAVELL